MATRDINEILAFKIRQLSDTQVVYTYYLGSFENYAELIELYPTAEDGSLAQTKDTNVLYFYNGSAWAAVTSGGVGAINDLSDVTITSPSTNQIIYYDGTKWINGNLPTHTLDSHSDVNTAGATSGQFLKYNGVQWVAATASTPTQMSDLSDVDTTGVTNNDVLIYNSSTMQWEPSAPSNPTVISDLTDVDNATPSGGDVLTWNAGNSWWEPAAPAAVPSALNDLTDVTITAAATGEVLYYNGSAWVDQDLASIVLTLGDYKGSYANSTALSTAYPSPSGNNWAIVAGDIWIHDGGGGWENTTFEIWTVDSSTESELETLSNFDTNNEYIGGSIISADLVPGLRHKHSSIDGIYYEVLEDGTWFRQDIRMPREALGSLLTPIDSDASASTSTKKISITLPFDCKVIDFVGGAMVAPVGSTATFDIHYEASPAGGAGTTIFSTKPTIDAGEYTTVTAATPAAFSTTTLAKGGQLHFYIDQVGSTTAGRGYSGFLNVYRVD